MDMTLLSRRLEALGSETRLEVYRAIVRAGREGIPVGTLVARTGVARSTLSHHLHKLIAVGLVAQRREGTTLHCVADYEAMDETLGFFRTECCRDAGEQDESVA